MAHVSSFELYSDFIIAQHRLLMIGGRDEAVGQQGHVDLHNCYKNMLDVRLKFR